MIILQDIAAGAMDYVAGFSRVILPVAYQFNPQLVIVAVDDTLRGSTWDSLWGFFFSRIPFSFHRFFHFPIEEKKMDELLALSTHWLTSLAGGRLLSLFEGSVPANTLTACARALNGDRIADPEIQEDELHSGALDRIRTAMRSLRPHWSALQFDIQLPEENVLVEPWMTDAATLEFNPEIRLF